MNIKRSCSFDEVNSLDWENNVMSRDAKFTYTNKNECKKLKEKKDRIGDVDSQTWLFARKLINVYEYPKIKHEYSISEGIVKTPVSRAYYKLWEILQDFNINCKGDSLHLAESPGGFIQATVDYRRVKYRTEHYKTYSVSLNSEEGDFEVPKFHKTIYETKNVEIFDFDKGDGDITKVDTFFNLQKELKSKEICLVTADGGINDHGEFNNKEIKHVNLIFSELVQAVFVLKDGGTFIVKIFDIFTDATVNTIYLLSYLFGNVKISKPLTSRYTNSEKYMVCTNFRKEKFTSIRNKLFRLLCSIDNVEGFVVESLFEIKSTNFIDKILKYNEDCISSQITNIDKILRCVGVDKTVFKKLKKTKEATIRDWLVKYKLIRV